MGKVSGGQLGLKFLAEGVLLLWRRWEGGSGVGKGGVQGKAQLACVRWSKGPAVGRVFRGAGAETGRWGVAGGLQGLESETKVSDRIGLPVAEGSGVPQPSERVLLPWWIPWCCHCTPTVCLTPFQSSLCACTRPHTCHWMRLGPQGLAVLLPNKTWGRCQERRVVWGQVRPQ